MSLPEYLQQCFRYQRKQLFNLRYPGGQEKITDNLVLDKSCACPVESPVFQNACEQSLVTCSQSCSIRTSKLAHFIQSGLCHSALPGSPGTLCFVSLLSGLSDLPSGANTLLSSQEKWESNQSVQFFRTRGSLWWFEVGLLLCGEYSRNYSPSRETCLRKTVFLYVVINRM